MNSVVAGAIVLAALAMLIVCASLLRRAGAVAPEAARKSVHIGMGAICGAFPWLFHDARPVLALAALAASALLAVRLVPVLRDRIGCALHDVRRRSYGEFAYIAGIATLFVMAGGDALVYAIPVAVLTLADPAASLVGMRFARHRFVTRDGSKSMEGSLAFFATSVACVTVPLLVAGRPQAVLGGVGASAVLMLIEASAWAGFDNFTIPFAGGIVMRSLVSAFPGGLR